MAKSVSFPLGSVIAVPLSKSKRFYAVVMRRRELRSGPRETLFAVIDPKLDVTRRAVGSGKFDLNYSDCRAFSLCSDLCVREGSWSVVGEVSGFSLEEWFVPPRVSKFHDDTDDDYVEQGFWANVLEDDCYNIYNCRLRKWITLAEYKTLPNDGGLGDAEALRMDGKDLLKKGPESIYWCEPTAEHVRLWRRVRELIIREGESSK